MDMRYFVILLVFSLIVVLCSACVMFTWHLMFRCFSALASVKCADSVLKHTKILSIALG
jgi:hypothetical protein